MTCNKCAVSQQEENFYFRKDTGRRRNTCKKCWDQKVKNWVSKNIEKRRTIALRWAKAHYPYLRMKKAEYRKKDPLRMRKWSIENPEKKKALNAAWRKNNKDKVTESTVRRNAIKLAAMPPWADKFAIQQVYKNAAKLGMHVDHVVPLRHPRVCGLHVEWNLQLLPPTENFKKGNRWQ